MSCRIAHDLNNLIGILGSTELLERRLQRSKLDGAIAALVWGGERARRLATEFKSPREGVALGE